VTNTCGGLGGGDRGGEGCPFRARKEGISKNGMLGVLAAD